LPALRMVTSGHVTLTCASTNGKLFSIRHSRKPRAATNFTGSRLYVLQKQS